MQNNRQSLTLFGPVVVGTDGTPDAHRAVRWAAIEADAREQPLTIVHATRTEAGHPHLSFKGIGQAKEHAVNVLAEAEALAGATAPGVKVTTTPCPYEPAACLLGQAGQEGTVVIGTRGHGGFLGLLVGSDALRVAARARVPTVVVPPRERDRPSGVVMVAARDDRDREAVRLAADLALRRGASLRVVSVWIFLENIGSMATMFDDPSELAAAESAEVSRLVARVREEQPGLDVTHDVVRAASAAAVLVAATKEADTVVIGSRRRSLPVGAPLGHVTHAVLHHAHCPVLLTPLSSHESSIQDLRRCRELPGSGTCLPHLSVYAVRGQGPRSAPSSPHGPRQMGPWRPAQLLTPAFGGPRGYSFLRRYERDSAWWKWKMSIVRLSMRLSAWRCWPTQAEPWPAHSTLKKH
ncbi:universal stress protein [Streptomyces clavifer]|uniref:universal stress protein n=1 Tax=Streptomyces clavifer TaxID=68188 RepID=UPI0036643C9E